MASTQTSPTGIPAQVNKRAVTTAPGPEPGRSKHTKILTPKMKEISLSFHIAPLIMLSPLTLYTVEE
jgi:hypothetical protein